MESEKDQQTDLNQQIEEAGQLVKLCTAEVEKRVVGQKGTINGILMGIIAEGHVLVEGVPGLAKTLIVKTVAESLDVSFKRIQFTPDLLPADIVGTMVYRQQTGDFVARKGPIFANIILADEINRAPAKVQSALLEAMQERQVTIGDSTYPLSAPFFVMATQNPIEQEGTYPLPEAQLDRFLMKLKIIYPSLQEEIGIIQLVGVEKEIPVRAVLDREHLARLQEAAAGIRVDGRIEEYIVSLVAASREKDRGKTDFVRYIEYGASPRASIFLYRCAKIRALFEGRGFVIPEDVKAVAHDVLRHRIILTYEAESEQLETDDIVSAILGYVHVP
jgi:MoxR-like ATPase